MHTEYLTPRNVYRLQVQARNAEANAAALAEHLSRETYYAIRAGAPIGSQDWQRDPEYRALQELADTLSEAATCAQVALGGVVYRVPSANIPAVLAKLDKLKRRAAKNGQTVAWCDDDVELVEHKDGSATRWHYIVLDAGTIKIAGWTFLAKLDIEEGGVLVSKIPGASRAQALYRAGVTDTAPASWERADEATAAAQAALDAMNLGAYADPDTARECDHCALDRRRKSTYLVEELATGEIKQVGSSCLRDFLGTDPHATLCYAEYLDELERDLGDEDSAGWGLGGSGTEITSLSYLTHVCAMIRTSGWAPRSGSDRPTADQDRENFWATALKQKNKFGQPMWVDTTEDDQAKAKDAIEWALQHYGAIEPRDLGDFERNMLVAAKGATVTRNTEGILAYLPVAHARFQEKEIELARAKETAAESEWVGQPGDRTDLVLTVTRVFETEGNYGTTFITQLEDADGNRFKWFGSYELERGKTYTGKWSVKAHGEYKGVKETQITRPAKVEWVQNEQTRMEVTA